MSFVIKRKGGGRGRGEKGETGPLESEHFSLSVTFVTLIFRAEIGAQSPVPSSLLLWDA